MSERTWSWSGIDEDWVETPEGDTFRADGAKTAQRIVDGMNTLAAMEAERDRLREALATVAVRLEELPNGHGHLQSYTAGIASYARDALTTDSTTEGDA